LLVNRKAASSRPVWRAKRISPRTSSAFRLTVVGRHVREVANSCGKSLSRDDEHRWADSPNRGAATPIRTSTTHILWRRFPRLLLVNGWREPVTMPSLLRRSLLNNGLLCDHRAHLRRFGSLRRPPLFVGLDDASHPFGRNLSFRFLGRHHWLCDYGRYC
jgi:hypothetical protein